ncbi:MAG: hypothetical protein IT371_06875, partial [Deltaproteobacteria bacterium]|nr:hypothetical protein [Deltaproteobacteria bacterium]
MAKPRRPARRLARALTLLGVLALGGALRFAPLPASRDAGHWVFTDGDSYYHLRRVEQTIQARGRVPMFDPELSYPEGQKLQWHGGYDLLVAGAVVVACGTTPTRPCLESVAILSTPLLGLAALLCLFALGRAIGGPRLGLLGAALFAVYPFAAGSAALGHVDHHVLEPLFVATWLALLVRGRPLAAGLVAGLSLACFPTAPWPAAVTLAALLGLRVVEGAASRVRPLPFALALLAVAWPVVHTGAFAETYEPSAVSRLHLVAFACAAAAALWVELVLRAVRLPR